MSKKQRRSDKELFNILKEADYPSHKELMKIFTKEELDRLSCILEKKHKRAMIRTIALFIVSFIVTGLLIYMAYRSSGLRLFR